MKIGTMNRNVLKDPRHKDFNYNTIALPFLVSLMKQPFLGNLNILNLQRQVLSKERATLIWTEWSTIQEVTSRNIPEHPKKPEHSQENQEHPQKSPELPKKTRNTPKKTRNTPKKNPKSQKADGALICHRARELL